MRTYLILKEKAARFNADREIQAILEALAEDTAGVPAVIKYSTSGAKTLLAHTFDRQSLASKRLPYERLDQITMEILLGVR